MTDTKQTQIKMSISADIIREDERWNSDAELSVIIAQIQNGMNDLANGHVTYVFANDTIVHGLNKEFRDKDKATNVLSFPDGDPGDDGEIHLGDVIVSLDTLQTEAKDQNKPFEDHLMHLLLHGTLHLIGYDHETDEDAEAMEALEIKILSTLGIKNPYQDVG